MVAADHSGRPATKLHKDTAVGLPVPLSPRLRPVPSSASTSVCPRQLLQGFLVVTIRAINEMDVVRAGRVTIRGFHCLYVETTIG
jgi:hypothetical protein